MEYKRAFFLFMKSMKCVFPGQYQRGWGDTVIRKKIPIVDVILIK